jgi:tripartite-type tricarboxylate transporter receptor subunit TctC
VVEAGYPKLVADNFLGISAPAGVPREVIEKVHKAVGELVATPEIQKRLADLGVTSEAMSQAQFSDFITRQVADWAPAVRASGARMN